MNYIEEQYRNDFDPADYLYESRIEIGRENQIGRFMLHFMHELDHTGRQCPAVGTSIHR